MSKSENKAADRKRKRSNETFALTGGERTFETINLIVLILIGALMVCLILMHLGESDIYSPLIFELAVFLTARYTQGYFYGIVATGVGVIGVNYAFTRPY